MAMAYKVERGASKEVLWGRVILIQCEYAYACIAPVYATYSALATLPECYFAIFFWLTVRTRSIIAP